MSSHPFNERPEFSNLGRHLKGARVLRGLSQRQLAQRCGLDQAHIARFEKGERLPTLPQLANLAQELGVSFQWFFNGTNWPGREYRDLAFELHALGVVDLLLPSRWVPAAYLPPEQVVALILGEDVVEPRIVEALPAVLAWNPWNERLLEAYAASYHPLAPGRLGWLADVTLTLHRNGGFPGGCVAPKTLAAFLQRVRPAAEPDSLGWPATKPILSPVWKRWNIIYGASLQEFRQRAEHLLDLRCHERSGPPLPEVGP